MAIILHIETSSQTCSVALSRDNILIGELTSDKQNDHAAHLTILIQALLENYGHTMKDLHAVSVSAGPGSYTGLRIGTSCAKGICHALNIPLIAVSTLLAMAGGIKNRYREGGFLYCPMIDARRMEVYCAVFDQGLQPLLLPGARILEHNIFLSFLSATRVVFSGSGVSKCRELLKHNNSVFAENISYTAKDLIPEANRLYLAGHFADPAYFEPFYLKNFYSGRQ